MSYFVTMIPHSAYNMLINLLLSLIILFDTICRQDIATSYIATVAARSSLSEWVGFIKANAEVTYAESLIYCMYINDI